LKDRLTRLYTIFYHGIDAMYYPVNRLKLDTRRDIERRLPYIVKRFSREYTVKFLGVKKLDPKRLHSTETGLESDKLGLVLKAVLYEGYEAPVIVILGAGGRLYIYDGHHRSKVNLWLDKLVEAFLIEVRGYKPRIAIPLSKTPVINPPYSPPEPILTWKHMVNIIWFLESRHNILARVWREEIDIEELYATQLIVRYNKRLISKEIPPVLVYYYDNKYYVIDGHNRVCAALASGKKRIESIVFTLNREIGLVKTSEALGRPRFNKQYCKL